MAKQKKEYWYLLIITNNGPVFVTSVDFSDKSAEWDKKEKPIELTKGDAQAMALGLNWHGNLAYPICSQWEIDKQPYRYENGKLEWVANQNSM